MANPPVDSFQVLPTPARLLPDALEEPQFNHAPEPTSAAQLADDLDQAGIAPDRASCPSLLQQLRQAAEAGVDTVICSAMDSDPLLPISATLAREHMSNLTTALRLLCTLLKPKRVLLVAEPAVLARCRAKQKCGLPGKVFRPIPLRADYPLTDARLLVYTTLRRKLSPSQLPTAARTIVLDAAAAAEIGAWANTGRRDATLPLAVRDHVRGLSRLVRAHRSTTVGEVLEALDIPSGQVLIRIGDFLRDRFAEPNDSVDGGELCLHITPPERPEQVEPCIRCAWCVEACPARIQPAGLLEAAQRDNVEMGERFGLRSCIECGICSYVCPSRLPLLPAIRQLLQRHPTQGTP